MKSIILSILIFGFSASTQAQKKYLKKADKYYANQDYLFAEKYYQKYLLNNEDLTIQNKLLSCLKAQSKTGKMQNLYKKMIAGGDQSYVYDYAQLLLSEEKYQEAQIQFENYISSNNSDSTAIILKAFASLKSNENNLSVACNKNEEKPYRAKYSAAGSIDPENPNIQFIWKFDDGETKKGVVVTKTYKTPGEHTVVLSSKDLITGYIDKEVKSSTLYFEPNLTFNYNSGAADIRANEKSNFNIDIPNPDVKYIWNMGDGTFKIGESVSHEYLSGKQYQLNVFVISNSLDAVNGCVEHKIPVLNNFNNK